MDVAKFSFSNWAVNEWNILGADIIEGNSLSGFKRKLDCHVRGIRGHIELFSSYFISSKQFLLLLTHQVQIQVCQEEFNMPLSLVQFKHFVMKPETCHAADTGHSW